MFKKRDGGGEATGEIVPQASGGTVVEQDVESPEIFQAAEAGLWDGRPSLGGVWVAHPEVAEPERVVIRNDENGKSVIGALFRRERENPGPRFQVSSDAATELGMLAGAPAVLDVVALRRVEVEVAPPVVTDAPISGEDISEASLGDDVAEIITETAPEPPKAAEPVAAMAAGAIEDAMANSNATAAQPSNALKPTVRPAQTAAAVATPAPAPATTGSRLDKPFAQIGIFSVQDNANNTADMLRNAGIIPAIKQGKSGDKSYWRVIVGPASTRSDMNAILKKVRDLGFADAYAVSG